MDHLLMAVANFYIAVLLLFTLMVSFPFLTQKLTTILVIPTLT